MTIIPQDIINCIYQYKTSIIIHELQNEFKNKIKRKEIKCDPSQYLETEKDNIYCSNYRK